MARKDQKYTVIRDTREQQGYTFNKFERCQGMVTRKLETGDYSILGLEDKICVERKGSIEELALNLGKNRDTFLREVKRMKGFPHRFIVLEFSLQELMDFPNQSRIPARLKESVKITGKFILKSLMEIQLNNDVHIVFCDNKVNAFLYINSLFKRLIEKYTIKETT